MASGRLARCEADTWNSKYPVGTEVTLRLDYGPPRLTRTRSKAWVTWAGFAVCYFEGFACFFTLQRATPVQKEAVPNEK